MPRGHYTRKTRKGARKAATTPIAPIGQAEGGRLTKIERTLAAFGESLKQITQRIAAPHVEEAPIVPVETPAERAKRELIEQLERSLALARGDVPAEETDGKALNGNGRIEEGPSMLEPGTYTPQAQFMVPMLKVLADTGKPMPTREVLKGIERKINLRPADHGKLPSNGAIRWENAVMFMRAKAKAMGLLEENSPRGFWQISSEGRKFLKHAK